MISINGDGENKIIYPILKEEISLIVEDKPLDKKEDTTSENLFSEMIDSVLEQLKADGITFETEIKKALSVLFKKAYNNKLYSESSESKTAYANDIATKLEIQLMIDNAECAKEEVVLKIYEELLGKLPDEGPDDNGFNVVAVIGEDKGSTGKENKFAQMLALEKTRIKGNNPDEVGEEEFILPDIDLENGYATVFDALKIGGKYPRKKNGDAGECADVELINELNDKVGADERVLYATYCKICYDNTEGMSKDAKGAYRPSFLNNVIQILAITDKKFYLCKSLYEVTITEIDREELKSINSIYDKKTDSLGQIQFDFKNGNSLIITIDRPIRANGNEKDIFDANAAMINTLFAEDIMKKEAESDYVDAVKHRYLKKIRVIEYLLSGEEESIQVSDVNKFIIKTIVESTSKIYEEIIEKPSEGIDKLIFMVQEAVIDERLNKLFGEEVFNINNQWETMGDEVKPLVQDVIEKTTESLDTLENEIRKQLAEVMGESGDIDKSTDMPDEEKLYNALEQLIGIEDVKEKIKQLITLEKDNLERKKNGLEVIESYNDCLCFAGNKGAGKATVAHIFEQLLFTAGIASTNNFVEVEDSDFDLETEEEIKGVFDIVKKHSEGGVALFSDIDKVIKKPNSNIILDQLLGFIENNRGNIRVIIAGKKDEVIGLIESNQSFKVRFRNIINFTDVPAEHLMGAFISILKQSEFSIEPEALPVLEAYFAKAATEPDFANINTVIETFKKLVAIHIQTIKESNDSSNLRNIGVNDVQILLSI